MNWAKIAKILLKINYMLAAIACALAIALYACKSFAKDIKVMAIDTGIGKHHMLDGYVQYDGTIDYKPELGHGTHVAGIIIYGNKAVNAVQLYKEAVCHNVKLYACNFYSETQVSPALTPGVRMRNCVKKAIDEKMDIINISAGGEGFSQPEYDLIKEYTNHGGIVVAAAGNENKELKKHPFYPASYGVGYKIDGAIDAFEPIKGVYAVSSVNDKYEYADGSNRDLQSIPEKGINIFSTLPNNRYGYMTGTSQAAPAFLHQILMYMCKHMEEKHGNSTNSNGD